MTFTNVALELFAYRTCKVRATMYVVNRYDSSVSYPNHPIFPAVHLSQRCLSESVTNGPFPVYTTATESPGVDQTSVANLPSTSSPSTPSTVMDSAQDPERADALEQYKRKLLESREWEAKLKALRLDIKGLQHEFDTTEDNIKALQSVGQIIGEVLKQLDEERCKPTISVVVAELPANVT